MSNLKIRTENVNPPIPMPRFNWTAWIDGREEKGPVGNGSTEERAIADLMEQMPPCIHCGESEPLHSAVGSFCREGDWYSSTLTFQQSTVSILDKVADQERPNTGLTELTTVGSSGEATATASPLQSLPVPLGREVSGTVDRHGAERLKATTTSGEPKERSTGSWPSKDECIRMTLASEVTISASPADQILPEPFTLQQTGATASTSLSVVPENFSCFIERIDEFVAVRLLKLADCFCGRPSIHECPCGEPICANHSYSSLCGTCTEAKQLQQSSIMDGADRYEGMR